MKTIYANRKYWAFTLIELLVIILIVVLLIPCLIFSMNLNKSAALRQNCQNNLKMVGLAYRTWALDGGDASAQGVETNRGGSKEWLLSGQIPFHYRTMSNELSTPRILVCPADKERVFAQSFGKSFGNMNISYFASLDARDAYPQMFLSGDRNLAVAGKVLAPGLNILTTNSAAALSWTRTHHNKRGNVGLADGSDAGSKRAGCGLCRSRRANKSTGFSLSRWTGHYPEHKRHSEWLPLLDCS